MDRIDLDQNATTPLDPAVLEAMRPHWLAGGNAESRHALGRAARRALDGARETVARILNAEPSEVVFTSGGTEANNLAILGLTSRAAAPGSLVAGPIEHPAVAEPLARRAAEGWELTLAPVDAQGRVDARIMASAFGPSTRLATLMLANNEVGAVQPVAQIARIAAERGIAFHTDAVQAVGRIAVDFHGLGVTTLAASAHKLHGPAGIGVLLIRKGAAPLLTPLLRGGGQEGGLRPGTVPVALCVGMAAALAFWHDEAAARTERWRILRERLARALSPQAGGVIHGPGAAAERLPQTLNVGFPDCDGDALLIQLDMAGVCASLGSACASGSTQPSPTLLAMGVAPALARASVRFSFGAATTEAEIDAAARRIIAVAESARVEPS